VEIRREWVRMKKRSLLELLLPFNNMGVGVKLRRGLYKPTIKARLK